ncbi:Uncharacterised protein [uncultured archaeon]|nr:Uncharacterised protein [uncultured archaeon]
MTNKIKNKTEKIIFLIAIFQILLMIGLTPAESYQIHQTDSSFSNNIVMSNNDLGKKIKNLLGIGMNLLIGFLSIDGIGLVSAAEIKTSCCPSTCDDVISTFTGCSKQLIPTTCANTDECRKGCCFDPTEGLCSTNAPKGKCEANGGEWSSDAICSISKCKKGCCVVGNNAIFTTDQNCAEISSGQGVEKDFRQQIKTESACLALTASSFEGACVLSGKNCKFESEKTCLSDGGVFHKDYLCSNPELETKCTKQASINCASGKDEIYWFDSCGNRENIYSSDKITSWNDGKILSKANSCGGSTGVIGSTSCGNCQTIASSCSTTSGLQTHISDGNFVCKDLGCKNAVANVGTQNRMNGERWCLYDGAIGDGKAVVGSEDWIAYCHNGNVSVERCGDYRSSVCQQQIITDSKIPNGFSTAACVGNDATKCLGFNSEYSDDLSQLTTKCNEDNQCMIKNIEVSDNFKFSVCVGKYPKGNDLISGLDGNGCAAMASQNCTVVYQKDGGKGTWNCIANCKCETQEFAKQMNELCMAIGDCGSNVNILGTGTDNVKLAGYSGKELDSDGKETDTSSSSGASAPGIYSWTHYISNAKPVANQRIDPKDISEEVAITFGIDNYDITNSSGEDQFGAISGWAGGAAISLLPSLFPAATTATVAVTPIAGGFAATTTVGAAAMSITSYCQAAGAILAGIWLGNFLGRTWNKSPEAMTWLMIMGGVAGAGVAVVLVWAGIAGGISEVPVVGWIIGAVMVLIAAIYFLWSWLSGDGKRETRVVEFKCQAWQAPNGGDNCDKCNNDPLRPCTAYRCSSLGKLCVLKNEHEQNPICFSLPKETNPPVISAGEVKTDGYKFQSEVAGTSVEIIKSDGSENGCIHEFNPLAFTLKTDEYSQCQYTFQKPSVPTYEDMNGNVLNENLFEKNHTFLLRIPSIEDSNIYDLTQQANENGQVVNYGKLNVYVKCQDGQNPPNYNVKEYVVNMCVNSGPDMTPVSFARAIANPENGAVLKFGTTQTNFSLSVNEPANCKYDTNAGINYDSMQYNLDCKTGINEAESTGWPCKTKLQNLIPGENKFYFKCKDVSGNVNTEDFVYTLKVSEKELSIDSVNFIYGTQKINFDGQITAGVDPVSINAQVKTSGGGYNGNSYCGWGISQTGNRWMMTPFDNAAIIHSQILTESGGSHIVYIDCQDDAGNEVSTSGEFTINVDTIPPVIIRAYKDSGNLKVLTDELAKCYYTKNTCTFDLNDTGATVMTGSYSTVQTAPWTQGITYYIRCKDSFGNAGTCTAMISPS